MKIIDQQANFITCSNNLQETIEKAGRVCWKSEDKIKPGSDESFIEKLISIGHESVIEHGTVTFQFIVDRGVSHEIVRHRLASYSQESTRYANYAKEKFGSELTLIRPPFVLWEDVEDFQNGNLSQIESQALAWLEISEKIEKCYIFMINEGLLAQFSRSVLHNSLKTEIYVTANVREWRHIFKLRCAKPAHPQIREVMILALVDLNERFPVIFGDLYKRFVIEEKYDSC